MLENPRKFKNSPNLLVPFCENYNIFKIFLKNNYKNYSFLELWQEWLNWTMEDIADPARKNSNTARI